MRAFSVAVTLTLPLVAVSDAALRMNAVMSFLISLRATLRPTETDSEEDPETDTDSEDALTRASIAEVSSASTRILPFADTVVAAST